MFNLRSWLLAARPFTLLISFATIFVGNGIAAKNGVINLPIFALTFLVTLLLQLLSNFANDLGDYQQGTDSTGNRIGPERMVQVQRISERAMLKAIIVTSVLCLIIGGLILYQIMLFANFWMVLLFMVIGILAIISAIRYTIGERPYGYYGLGDFFSFIFFGPVAVMGMVYLYSHEFSFEPLLPALGVGLLSASVLNVNNMRDIENDQSAGKMTFAVMLGFERAKIYHLVLNITAFICFLLYNIFYAGEISQMAYLLMFIPFVIMYNSLYRITNHKKLQPLLFLTIAFNALFALLFALSIS